MPKTHPYWYRLVDVFSKRPFQGNQLAVFPYATGLDRQVMQQIAKELNLAESAFVLTSSRPDCAAQVRIFTPKKEMEFAGHPTIGTAFVLLSEMIVPPDTGQFCVEEGVGPVCVTVEQSDPPLIWLRTPPIEYGRTFDPTTCARALGLENDDLLAISPQCLTAGNPTIFVPLSTKEAVDRAWLDLGGLRSIKGFDEPMCVFVFTPTQGGAYSRMFAPEYGIPEDPATGSSTGPLAAFMMQNGLLPRTSDARFVSVQGVKMGRPSILHIRVRGEGGNPVIDIGGHVTEIGEGILGLWDRGKTNLQDASRKRFLSLAAKSSFPR